MKRRRVFWIIVAVMGVLAITTTTAWADDGTGTSTDISADALWVTLAPVIAIATATERILEMFWERWEKVGLRPNKNGVADTSSPDYILRKKSGSHWLGTLVAIVAVGLTNARFFRLLGLDVLFSNMQLFQSSIGGIFDDFTIGTLVDWILTAGIVGWGGTELTHSVIEGLVKGRNLWGEMREVEAGRKSILDAKFFNDYIVPRLKDKGISVDSLRQTMQTLNAVGISPDQLIGSLTSGKVSEFLGSLEAKPETAAAGQSIRTLLEGVPPQQAAEIPNILNLLTHEQRQRFLGS